MPSLKISEHTDRPELIDYLKRNLGVQFKVFQELIFEKKHLQEDIIIFKTERIEIDRANGKINCEKKDDFSAII